MDQSRTCPQCGAELPRDAMQGLCPKCMARVVFGEAEAAGAQSDDKSAAATLERQADVTTERAGMMIGRYKLLKKIGEGGFGVVYLAEQLEPVQRKVALKVIKAGMDTREVIARFEAERQALALMDHPNIAKILDAGVTGQGESEISNLKSQIHGGRPYFVMELVKGIPITDYCDQNRLPVHERLQLFMKVCQAVQHAHQKAIIHRDLKPSNVLVTLHDGEPVPKVIDFGIAKALGPKLTEKTLFTNFAHLLGTPAYMSPEQAELGGLDIDTRSDIYALGVLLYELLTGVTPFDRELLAKSAFDEMRRMIRETEPPKPSTRLSQALVAADKVGRVTPPCAPLGVPPSGGPDRVNAGLQTADGAHGVTRPAPKSEEELRASSRRLLQIKETIRVVRGDLDWIVMKCLEKDRNRRYETANGLARDIQRHLNCEPVVARPPSRLYEFQKTVRRHKFGFAAGAAVITVLAVGVLVSTWQAIRATRAEREQTRLRETAQTAQANEAQLRQLAEADRKRAELERQRAEKNAAEETRQRLRAEEAEKDAQRKLWESYLAQARANRWSGRAGRRFDSLEVLAKAAAMRDLLQLSQEAMLPLRNEAIACMALADLRLARDWPGALLVNAVVDPRFSVRAQSDSQGNVTVYSLDENRELIRLPVPGHPSYQTQFSPDGRFLAARYHQAGKNNPNKLQVWEWEKGKIIWHAPYNTYPSDFSPDSRLLGFRHWDGPIILFDLEASKEVKRLTSKVRITSSRVRFSPDGQRLAVSSTDDHLIEVLDLASGSSVADLRIPGVASKIAWHPEGKRLAASSYDRKVYILEVGTGQIERTLIGHQGVPIWLSFTRGGDLLATSGWDSTTRLWDVTTGKLLVTFPAASLNWPQFSENDQLLALVYLPPRIGMLNVATGRELLTLPGHPGEKEQLFSVDFSRDSRWMASGGTDGVRLWDLAASKEVAFLPLRHGVHRGAALFHADGRSLITSGQSGVRRWPIVFNPDGVQIGSPAILSAERGFERACFSPDGQRLAVAHLNSQVLVFDLGTTSVVHRLPASPQTSSVAYSPDGRWLAGGCWKEFVPPRIWNAETGEHVLDLPIQANAEVAFSPDGHWLVTATGTECSFWQTGTWTLHHTVERIAHRNLAGDMRFSRDGTILAVGLSDTLIRLVEPDTGRELATLETAMQRPLGFTPDGTRLVVEGENRLIHIWDLRAIREQLAAMKLDW